MRLHLWYNCRNNELLANKQQATSKKIAAEGLQLKACSWNYLAETFLSYYKLICLEFKKRLNLSNR